MDAMVSEPVRGVIGDMSFLARPGIETMRRFVRPDAGRPPIHHLTGLTPTSAGLGTMTFAMPVTRWLEDSVGIIWGGVYAFAVDAPISLALYTGLPAGKMLTTSELSINYLRPATRLSDRLVARARSVYLGKDVGVAEATVEDGTGRTMAHATTRCVVIEMPFDPDAQAAPVPAPILDPPDPYLRTPPDEAWLEPSVFDGDKVAAMRRFSDGEFPQGPVQRLTGSRVLSVEAGRMTMSWPASPWFSAGGPAMYGGAIAWACDTAIASTVWSTLEPHEGSASLDLQVRFLRPVMLDGSNLTVIGEIKHRGRSIRIANAEVLDAKGRRVALASGASYVIPDGIEALKQGRQTDEIVGL